MSERYKDNKKIMKVHFVSHGYEKDSYDLKTDSSTCNHKAMRIVMLTSSVIGWQVDTLDFTSAFLLGDILEREVLDHHLVCVHNHKCGS